MIDLTTDFREFLIELADAGAEFLLIGGYAVGFHGHPRATKDIDILVRPTRANAANIIKALSAFGAPLKSLGVNEEDFADYKGVVQIGAPPNRIDILTQATGITYDEGLIGSADFDLDGRVIKVIGLDALLKNKRAAGRAHDLIDANALEKNRE